MNMWIIQIYENGEWRVYGQASSNFGKLYKMCEKFAENGTKARVVRANTIDRVAVYDK